MNEESKKTLGEFLKSERERRGLTIEQTSSATKIGLKILKQLEADRYADLPALPFVRGFVRNYGKFLGLDGEKLLAEYADFLEAHASERPKRDAGHSGYAFERPEGEQSRKVLWGVMAGMLVFGGAVVLLFKPSLKRKHHGHIDKLKPGGTESDPSAESSPIPSISATPLVGASATPSSTAIPSGTPAPAVSPAPLPAVPASAAAPAIPALLPTQTPVHLPPAPSPSPEKPFVPPKTPLVLAPSPLPTHAAPTPSPTSSPGGLELSPDDDLKKDPLQSGTNYPVKEIKTKLILRTKADVWVRYRCDAKKPMKFALRKDKILVLRGKTSVYLQVSNPDSITIQASGQAESLFSQNPGVFEFAGNSTVAFPSQAREKIEENFKTGAPLPFTPSPAPTP